MVGVRTPKKPLAGQLGAFGTTGMVRVDPAGHPEAVPYEDVPALIFGGGPGGGPGGGGGVGSAIGGVPYYIPPDGSYTVPLYIQALFEQTIDNEGILEVDGFLIQVD